MSGIAGLVPRDGAPVDAALLHGMAAFLAFRGPHGERSRVLDGCGLAHALLSTGDRPDPLPQPYSPDEQSWIIADARIDARDELARALRGAGHPAPPGADDAELIARAWQAWDTRCVERLIGDFAFAVWDAPRRRLFCARDALGVKPFYHASTPDAFVFSNTLECVLLHPQVDRGLDEAAVADFLVHGFARDVERTIRRGVRPLPPGHAMTVDAAGVRVSRWWSPPVEEPSTLRRPEEYGEAFREVLGAAVRDRTPSTRAAIYLSGGRDSPTVAALVRETRPETDLHAFTAFHDHLIREEERRYAAMAADALRIPVTWRAADGYRLFDGWESDDRLLRPEPLDAPLLALEADQAAEAAAHAPVILTGFGGDAVMRETRSRLARLLLGGHAARAIAEAAAYARIHRRIPRPGVRTWLRLRGVRQTGSAEAPAWLDPGFVRRVDLPERLAAQNAWSPPPHPTRPEAYEQVLAPLWPALFTALDPGVTRVPVEHRHPFMDVRVVRFLLSVPPAQWYNDKGLIRLAMRGRLPEPLLARPKTPLQGDPLAVRYQAEPESWLGGRALGAEIEPFVDRRRVPRATGGLAEGDAAPLWLNLRPLALSLWLRRREGGG